MSFATELNLCRRGIELVLAVVLLMPSLASATSTPIVAWRERKAGSEVRINRGSLGV
jgi:hypothetical protein